MHPPTFLIPIATSVFTKSLFRYMSLPMYSWILDRARRARFFVDLFLSIVQVS
jgi:hypothetical protein